MERTRVGGNETSIALEQKHHQKRDDGGHRVHHQLPRLTETEERPRYQPSDDHQDRDRCDDGPTCQTRGTAVKVRVPAAVGTLHRRGGYISKLLTRSRSRRTLPFGLGALRSHQFGLSLCNALAEIL